MTTRAELFTQVQNYLRRANDTEFVAALPTMLTLLEARIATDIVHSSQLVTTTLSFIGRSGTIPTDVNSFESVTLTFTGAANSRVLEYVSPEVIREKYEWGGTTAPVFYTIENRSILIAPAATTSAISLDLVYYQRFPALTADADTNYLLTNYFPLYLYGMLEEAGKNLQDAELRDAMAAEYAVMRAQILEQDTDYRVSGSRQPRLGNARYIV